MANEQTNANEAIAKAWAEATREAMEAMAAARAERTQIAGTIIGRPTMKQPTFNSEAEDKYNKCKNFRL